MTTTKCASALMAVPAASLHISKPTNWLASRFHFSFAGHYYNEDNRNQFGVLRVLNDDQVKAHNGFTPHPHRDMEILSYILDGELTHQDSMGSAEALGRGSVQFMSAGTGVMHSEMNQGNVVTRFLQVWIVPSRRGMTPRYGSRRFTREQRLNTLNHFVFPDEKFPATSNDAVTGPIGMGQDVNFLCSELEAGRSVEFGLGADRQAYLVNAEGMLEVRAGDETLVLGAGDAVEINQKTGRDVGLTFTSRDATPAHFVLIEMKRD